MRRRVRADFEPPAYIASLITSINDGAKAAQTGALFMLAVAVYLMATVIATTDEVLLRGTFLEFSQIGVKVPVVAAYALAPIVFLFLHVHTLICYDMLAENLQLLDRELHTTLPREADRDRCRQLLANVELVQYWASPAGSRWHSRLYAVLVWVMLVAVPVLVFLATQISFLRYQNAFVTCVVHMGCLALDLAALVYFWYRQARRQQDWQPRGRTRAFALNALPAVLLFTFAAVYVYLGIPPPDSTTTGEGPWRLRNAFEDALRSWRSAHKQGGGIALAAAVWAIAAETADDLSKHPLDLGLCPHLGWGCRYLRLDHRLLVEEKPDADTLYKLRTGEGDLKKLLVRVEALFLRGRRFRFADFEASEFYDADLQEADLAPARFLNGVLKGADLRFAQMQGADLDSAQMQRADMRFAQMQGADLRGAQLQGANLNHAHIQRANLHEAQLQGVDLQFARMEGADLSFAHMHGADLTDAWMHGANLGRAVMRGANLPAAVMRGANLPAAVMRGANLPAAVMRGANLSQAHMQGAYLSSADLRGADLRSAQMQGATLIDTEMQGADLRGAGLWQAVFDRSNLSLADLRRINFVRVHLRAITNVLPTLDAIPDEERRVQANDRVTSALTLRQPPATWTEVQIEPGRPALVDTPDNPYFANVKERLMTDEKTYDVELAVFLADLGGENADVARGITERVRDIAENELRRALWPDLARRLLAAEKEGAFTLDLSAKSRETLKELAAKAAAPPP